MKFAFVCARVPCLLLLSRRAAGTKNCVERGLDKTPRSAHSARVAHGAVGESLLGNFIQPDWIFIACKNGFW
jgi:hypothetical protein